MSSRVNEITSLAFSTCSIRVALAAEILAANAAMTFMNIKSLLAASAFSSIFLAFHTVVTGRQTVH